jgi:hypothetical protein
MNSDFFLNELTSEKKFSLYEVATIRQIRLKYRHSFYRIKGSADRVGVSVQFFGITRHSVLEKCLRFPEVSSW